MSSVPPGPSLRGAVDLSALVQRASRPPQASAADGDGGASSSLVVAANDETFPRLIELSSTVPVLIEFLASGMQPALGALVESYEGRMVLAVVDAQTNPQLAQAFQLREVPAVAAVVGGRPIQLFVGMPPEEELRPVLDELLQLAAQNGVTGQIPVDGAEGAVAEEPGEPPLPPLHQEAYDAIARGDYDAAIAAYRQAVKENPRDVDAVAGLAQVSLLQRLEGADAAAIRTAAAERPADVDAQLAVADLDAVGGHVEDAFDRLLELFPSLDADGKGRVRARLLEYFEITGPDDERVSAARRRLSTLLY